MSFCVFTDGSANLPASMLSGIRLLPCSYSIDGETCSYDGDIDHFDGPGFYNKLRSGKRAQTTLLNSQLFISEFTPVLESGNDIIYISMSSGISGTFNAARIAAEELKEQFPDRDVFIIDSLGCGFGSGLLAVDAAKLSVQGIPVQEAVEQLNQEVPHTCQYFTVDDLNYLKTTGRVSGMTAKIATVLNIKPILYGDPTGHIEGLEKIRGRKASIEALVRKYSEKVVSQETQTVCISHGDCPEDAKLLADRINEVAKPARIVICEHEPFSGSHVGPGMLGIFFKGKER